MLRRCAVSLIALLLAVACGPKTDTTAGSTDEPETETGAETETAAMTETTTATTATTGYESTYSTGDSAETAGGNLCEMAIDRIIAKYESCGIDVSDTDGGGAGECSEEAGLNAQCVAACVEAASCGAFDGSDLDASAIFGDCVTAC
ncbi:MAG: hypothetical protein R3A51_20270 [Nannocystaceae bacterium]